MNFQVYESYQECTVKVNVYIYTFTTGMHQQQQHVASPIRPGQQPPQQMMLGQTGPISPRGPTNQSQAAQQAPPGGMQQKQNKITPVTKPDGLDPVQILQERENRY